MLLPVACTVLVLNIFPQLLWKAFIDFEISENEADNVRALFGRLLERTNHVKVGSA